MSLIEKKNRGGEYTQSKRHRGKVLRNCYEDLSEQKGGYEEIQKNRGSIKHKETDEKKEDYCRAVEQSHL